MIELALKYAIESIMATIVMGAWIGLVSVHNLKVYNLFLVYIIAKKN